MSVIIGLIVLQLDMAREQEPYVSQETRAKSEVYE